MMDGCSGHDVELACGGAGIPQVLIAGLLRDTIVAQSRLSSHSPGRGLFAAVIAANPVSPGTTPDPAGVSQVVCRSVVSRTSFFVQTSHRQTTPIAPNGCREVRQSEGLMGRKTVRASNVCFARQFSTMSPRSCPAHHALKSACPSSHTVGK